MLGFDSHTSIGLCHITQRAGDLARRPTGRESLSLGAERYHQLVCAEGLALVGEMSDKEDNHYYLVRKP
jgi:D-lyxose ketol-isomerase